MAWLAAWITTWTSPEVLELYATPSIVSALYTTWIAWVPTVSAEVVRLAVPSESSDRIPSKVDPS